MTCNDNIKVYISDLFILFPYDIVKNNLPSQIQKITIFVPTYEDEKVINADILTTNTQLKRVNTIKYVSHYEEDEIGDDMIVFWNVIVPINLKNTTTTLVFSVVLSDNLYSCNNIEFITPSLVRCPLQVDYHNKMVCLKGEFAGDLREIQKAINETNKEFVIHFDKHTPMGIKILNTKRFLIALSRRQTIAKVFVYLPHNELTNVHKELSWESVRRLLRGGPSNTCNILNRSSYKYIIDAMEILNINNSDISSVHDLTYTFNPIILRYMIVPTIFVELNNIFGEEKLVRLYCKYESVAITNAGPVPINMPSKNKNPFKHRTLKPPPESLYKEIGNRNAYLHSPVYNYFL
uniref:Odv-ec43 n=1 Tax=Cryptophlebia leucotreta granulosis virus TaxID=35254 RepID=A0A2H4ZKA1_GVCL|nr:odv-ec43 [Cryptophlebia leucotreta granulovirus]